MPKRIQRQRTKGWLMPAGAIYVGRPTPYGNPFRAGDLDEFSGKRLNALQAIARFRQLWTQTAFEAKFRPLLEAIRGKDLACWCPLNKPCHADVLLELANR